MNKNIFFLNILPDTINHNGILGSIWHFSLLNIPIISWAIGRAENKAIQTVLTTESRTIEIAVLARWLGFSKSLAALSCEIMLKPLYEGGGDEAIYD